MGAGAAVEVPMAPGSAKVFLFWFVDTEESELLQPKVAVDSALGGQENPRGTPPQAASESDIPTEKAKLYG